jgi:16S rRNA C967 or C1407 C5-methylase (RsmB/RsmF family)
MRQHYAAAPVFEAVPVGEAVPAALCSDGRLETFPHIHGIDGAFAAKFRRKAL